MFDKVVVKFDTNIRKLVERQKFKFFYVMAFSQILEFY